MRLLENQTFASLILAGSLLALTACGSTVTFGEGTGGGGGSGGSGLVGPGGGGPDPEPCQPAESCNPAQCPSQKPSEWTDCTNVEGLSCSYDDGDCVVTVECQRGEDCWDAGSGGSDGGGCESWTSWMIEGVTCDTPGVPCEQAQEGDPCDVPGDYCGEGFDCEWTDKECGTDHKWHVYDYYDECCYEDCGCYDDGPYYCPETIPESGMFCDPCYEGPYCEYEVETECGIQSVGAWCDEFSWSWEITPIEPCAEPG